MLVVWQFEGCPFCQRLRQRLSELAVDYVAVNAPHGQPEKDEVMRRLFPSAKVPALWDTHASRLVQGPEACLRYVEGVWG